VRAASAATSGFRVAPGTTRCESCGRFFASAEVVQNAGRNTCADCKPPAQTASDDETAHARVLGLRGRVTFTDIKRHYRERMLEYHPDRVAALGPKLREVAEHETKKINAAYEFFTARYSKRNV
jgi:hypothetical protein